MPRSKVPTPPPLLERLRSLFHRPRIRRLYRRQPFLEAYARHTDLRVDRDPTAAGGRLWEEVGLLQFEFLRGQGLAPHHSLLDIGCGTLRGGRHFIGYLDSGGYTGFDISERAISAARELVAREGLGDKEPTLLVDAQKQLDFQIVAGRDFDYLLAQSVFTHLMPEHIREGFAHLPRVMGPGSRFFFTYRRADRFERQGLKDFAYPSDFFGSLADELGYALVDHSEHYAHPRGQSMLEVRRPG